MFDISSLSRCNFTYDPLLERPFNGDFNGVSFIIGGCIPEILIAFKKFCTAEAAASLDQKELKSSVVFAEGRGQYMFG